MAAFHNKTFAMMTAASLVLLPVDTARANGHGGALLGGLLLGAIVAGAANGNARQRQAQQPQMSAAQREQNRQVQTALNYFGYNVGTVDGSLGPRSRAAISDFQSAMGYPVDGVLDDYERAFLTGSQQRAQAVAYMPPYDAVMAEQGPRGLLRRFRNEQLGYAAPGFDASANDGFGGNADDNRLGGDIGGNGRMAAENATLDAQAPEPAPAPAPAAALTTFGVTVAANSANQHCSEINVLTATNGGYMTAVNMTDGNFALNEQFCLARTFAISTSNRQLASLSQAEQDGAVQQCLGVANYLAPQIDMLDAATSQDVARAVTEQVQAAGSNSAALISTGEICLGVGYRTDDARVALGASLLLIGAGQAAYGEMIAHHLREGFGAAPNESASFDWMTATLDALDRGATPAFLPDQSAERVAVLTVALGGGTSATSTATTALPVFGAGSAN